MITYLDKPYKDEEIFSILNPIVRNWFKNKFKTFSEPQKYAVLPIHNRENVLVSAVTGSGKTLTAFTSILNELINLSEQEELQNKVYCIYISPLKALNNDVSFNLEQPLKEMEELAKKKFNIKIAVRTGDTTATEKQKMLKETPHVLVTTPESLALILTSPKFREKLREVKYCIIDEVHSLAENKRGVHLSLSLERLNELAGDFTRIGLSATAEPIEEIAKFVTGNRNCKIAKIDLTKKMDLKVLCPLTDMINTTHEEMHYSMYELINKLIQDHKTTLIFTNTRSATERVVHYLKEKFPKNYTENIGAHHGSLSKQHRLDMEKRMREGKLKAIVCSTSLELGIDIGYIDLVIMLGSPKSVARATQRAGRAGHKLHDIVKGRIIVLDRDDLIESSVMLKNVLERNIDKIHIPENALDVLAQQIYGIAISDQIHIDDLFKLVKRSYCYRNLSREDFMEVIKYLSGFYNTLEDRNVYAKIWYDESNGMIGKKGKLARVIYMTNVGTIPDETFITVKIGEQVIGHLDENFLERMKRGDVFTLGGQTYEFGFSRGMVAQVKSSANKTPTIPNWVSEMLPLSFDLALEIGKFRRLMEEKFRKKTSKKEILEFIDSYLYVDKNASLAIYNYFNEQFLYLNEIPNDKKILIEHYSEDNKKYVIFHSLFGRRVNDCLARALGYAIGKLQHKDVEIGINDNGFYLSYEGNLQVIQTFKLFKSQKIRELLERAIDNSEILKRRFRHCATRSLMILREYKGMKKRVGRQQVSSMLLINALKRISNDFSILKEAKREVLEDLMDVENTTKIFKKIENDEIKLKEVFTKIPSPFAFNIVLQGYLDILKMEDKIKFLRNMHTLILAKIGKENEIEYEN